MMRSIVLGARLGVERREHEVAGLGRGQRRGDRLEVAHLAEEDHVGVLAQRTAQRLGEADRVLADLALVDDAALVVVQELDRVLDRDDVVGAGAVDLVDQRRERGRLTRARRAGHEHEAARLRGELVERGRQAELLERGDRRRDHPEGGREALALVVGVDTEAGEPADAVCEVELLVELEMLLLLGRRDPVDELPHEVGVELGEVGEQLDVPVEADGRQRAGRQMEVGCPQLDGLLEQGVDREQRGVRMSASVPRWHLSAPPRPTLRVECTLVRRNATRPLFLPHSRGALAHPPRWGIAPSPANHPNGDGGGGRQLR